MDSEKEDVSETNVAVDNVEMFVETIDSRLEAK